MHESVVNRPSRMKRAESSFCYYALFTRTSKCTHVLVLNERRKDGGGSRHSSSLSRLIVRSFVRSFFHIRDLFDCGNKESPIDWDQEFMYI